jgi:hypothetical protein
MPKGGFYADQKCFDGKFDFDECVYFFSGSVICRRYAKGYERVGDWKPLQQALQGFGVG